MTREAYQATEIVIGKSTNKLSLGSDGSLLLQDTLVGPVKLSDLVGGEVVIDPALVVLIEDSDWVAQAPVNGQVLYRVNIQHNWALTNVADTEGLLPISVDVNIWDENNTLIQINKIWVDANKVYLESSRAINMKVSVKRIN